MSPADEGRRPPRSSQLIDAAEETAAAAGRLGYGMLSFALGLLPRQSRTHMHNAVRELSYAFVDLPRTFAEYARPPIEAWAAEGVQIADHHASHPAGAASSTGAPAQRVPITSEPASPPPAAAAVPPGATPQPDDAGVDPSTGATATGAATAGTPGAPSATSGASATGPLGARPGLAQAGAARAAAARLAITHIEYDPPGKDVDGEYVLIRNGTAAPVDLTGWTLHDGKAIHSFVFPPFTLAPGAEVKLWTKAGANDAANLHWGERRAIWNNDGDTGTLKNAAGAVISSFTYAGSK